MKKLLPIILLESNQINKIGDICKFDYGLNIAGKADIGYPAQHLYIIDPEAKIEEGDYVIEDIGGTVYGPIDKESIIENPKKIIATTDKSLRLPEPKDKNIEIYNYLLPRIPESFIKSYITNPVKEVFVEFDSIEWLKDADTLKLTSNNEIIIHENNKVYSREEVIDLISDFIRCEDGLNQNFDIKNHNKWISDNL